MTHTLISYSTGFFGLGDKFSCLCGLQGILDGAKRVETRMCDQPCPVDELQCGQPDKELLR